MKIKFLSLVFCWTIITTNVFACETVQVDQTLVALDKKFFEAIKLMNDGDFSKACNNFFEICQTFIDVNNGSNYSTTQTLFYHSYTNLMAIKNGYAGPDAKLVAEIYINLLENTSHIYWLNLGNICEKNLIVYRNLGAAVICYFNQINILRFEQTTLSYLVDSLINFYHYEKCPYSAAVLIYILTYFPQVIADNLYFKNQNKSQHAICSQLIKTLLNGFKLWDITTSSWYYDLRLATFCHSILDIGSILKNLPQEDIYYKSLYINYNEILQKAGIVLNA